jgi:hypothetical protein
VGLYEEGPFGHSANLTKSRALGSFCSALYVVMLLRICHSLVAGKNLVLAGLVFAWNFGRRIQNGACEKASLVVFLTKAWP